MRNHLLRAAAGNTTTGFVTDNLILHLDAASYSSGTTWTDESGQGNNGTLTNGVSYSSDNDGVFVFDGTNDRVNLPAGSDFAYGTGDFTVEIWFNVTGTSPQTWGEIAFSQTVSGTNYFALFTSAQNPVQKKPTFIYGTGNGTYIISSTAYTEDTWYHYVVTRNGTALTMYLNNSVVATDTVSFNFNNTTYAPAIGAYTHSDNLNLEGKISIVRVYKGKGFSASDVTQNWNVSKARHGLGLVTDNLILHLDASNYSSGSTWTDESGQGNNGTLTNGVSYSSDNGGVLVFDGTDDYVTTSSDMFNANSNFTFSIWFYSDTFASGSKYSFIADINNSQSLYLRYDTDGGSIDVVNSNINVLGSFSNSSLSTNTWYNITVTRSSNTYTLYINGSSISTLSSSHSFTHSPNAIGANYKTSSPYYKHLFDGKIGIISIYNSAISASDVTQNWNTFKVRYGY